MNCDRCTFMTAKFFSFILSLTKMPQNFIPKMLYKINTDLSQATENTTYKEWIKATEVMNSSCFFTPKHEKEILISEESHYRAPCSSAWTRDLVCSADGKASPPHWSSKSFMQDNHTRLVYTQRQALKLWSHTESSTAEKFPRAKFSLSSFAGLFQPAHFWLHSASWSFILTDIK